MVKHAQVGATGRSPLRKMDGTGYAAAFTQASEVLKPGGWYLMPDDEREVFDVRGKMARF